jgi:tetratricopeptide (TPR) repeat protein
MERWARAIGVRSCYETGHAPTANPRGAPSVMTSRLASLVLPCLLGLAVAGAVGQPAVAQDGQRLALEAARQQAQGNLEQALNLLNEALNDARLTTDRRGTIHTDRGALFARLNQPKAAIEDFNRAVQLYPEYPAIYNNRGSTLLTLGLAREAIRDFDRAIVLAPGYVAAYNNRAGARLLLGQIDAAIEDFTRALELDAGTLPALAGRGRALLAANRPQAAQRDFSHALANDNRFALGYRQRAQARLAADKVAEAIEDLSRASAFEPANVDIYIERGNAYMQADNPAAALKDYAKALELDPQSLAALEARAFAHVRVDAHNEAEADATRALELSQRATAAMAARALLYLRTGQPDLARREIDRAQRISPQRYEVLLARADIDAAAGKRDDAVQGYRAALVARPGAREPAAALARLTGVDERSEAVELRGHGFEHWRVVRRGLQHVALSSIHGRIVVPLETVDDQPPKIIDFEVQRPPYRDFGLLHFIAGQLPGPSGPEEVVHTAIIDLAQGVVLGVVPDRRGTKRARWNWEDSRLVVTSIDGLTDEFVLRGGRPQAVAAVPPRRPAGEGPRTYAPPTWLPFGALPPPRQQRRQQPKSIFDLLFGN